LARRQAGYDIWVFITADFAFVHDLEQNTADIVATHG
jgi:hypothetical protein